MTENEAYLRLEDLCSRGEYSAAEATERLRRWEIEPASAHAMVQQLIDRRFIDDERFARAYVRSKVAYARWGRIKIRQMLRTKGIEPQLITQAMDEELDYDLYCTNLADLLRSKARPMPEILEREHRDKLLRAAISRGYETSLILEMLPEEDFWRYPDDSAEDE